MKYFILTEPAGISIWIKRDDRMERCIYSGGTSTYTDNDSMWNKWIDPDKVNEPHVDAMDDAKCITKEEAFLEML